ncbi:MAG: hypothetical protein AB8H79_09005 [Myxococcota bacterium]
MARMTLIEAALGAVGTAPDSEGSAGLLAALGELGPIKRSSIPGTTYLEVDKSGVSASIAAGVLTSVQLHLVPLQNRLAYKGELPLGASATDSIRDLIRRLGPPKSSGGARQPRVRYEVQGGVIVSFIYRNQGQEMTRVVIGLERV